MCIRARGDEVGSGQVAVTRLGHRTDEVDVHAVDDALDKVIDAHVGVQFAQLAHRFRRSAIDAQGDHVVEWGVAQRGAQLVDVGGIKAVGAQLQRLVDHVGAPAAAEPARRQPPAGGPGESTAHDARTPGGGGTGGGGGGSLLRETSLNEGLQRVMIAGQPLAGLPGPIAVLLLFGALGLLLNSMLFRWESSDALPLGRLAIGLALLALTFGAVALWGPELSMATAPSL